MFTRADGSGRSSHPRGRIVAGWGAPSRLSQSVTQRAGGADPERSTLRSLCHRPRFASMETGAFRRASEYPSR